jgi:hypothetical protein
MGPAGFPPSDEVVLSAGGPQHPGSSPIARVGTPDDRAGPALLRRREGVAACVVTVDRATPAKLPSALEPLSVDLQPGAFEITDRNHPRVPVAVRR